jgi:hypothetical protein
LLPELLPGYRGKFVAIHEGKVVDSDADDIALVQRVHAQVGYVPIHVGLVSEQPVIVRIAHYRKYHAREESLLTPGASYPIWSPFDAFDAARVLNQLLDCPALPD